MALKDILKKYDYYVCSSVPPVKRLRSGVFSFDLVTGGGIPLGRFTEFHGDKSTGKSSFALRLTGKFLDQFQESVALYVDFEQSFEPTWARNFIKDLDRVYVVQPSYGEEGVDLIIQASREPEVGFVVVDSLATIVPSKEADSDSFSANVASQARIVSSMLRRLLPVVSQAKKQGRELTFLLINQIRVKFDAHSFGSAVTKPAGKMQDAVVSMDIRWYAKEYHKQGDIPVKVTYTFNVEKNKVGGHPKRAGEFVQYLIPINGFSAGDVEDERIIIKYARLSNLLVKDGAQWHFLGHRFKSLQEIEMFIRQNRQEIYDKVLLACLENYNLFTGGDNEA